MLFITLLMKFLQFSMLLIISSHMFCMFSKLLHKHNFSQTFCSNKFCFICFNFSFSSFITIKSSFPKKNSLSSFVISPSEINFLNNKIILKTNLSLFNKLLQTAIKLVFNRLSVKIFNLSKINSFVFIVTAFLS